MNTAAQQRILVGLSGGPDSVALLHMLHNSEVGSCVVATHCNFQLRGEESDRDEQFCRQLCAEWGIELLVKHFDTRAYMSENKVSLELAARQLRYAWWEELCQQLEAEGLEARIAVAHHRDDSLETMLFNLMRGTGIKGLTGIPAVNGHIIRPLLSFSRQQILDYLTVNQLSYITDSSNLETEATRNKIRLLLLPLMEQILPQARQGLATTMKHLQQTSVWANACLNTLFASTTTYNINGITWHEWLAHADADEETLDELFFEWRSRYGATAQQKGRLFYTIADVSAMQPNFKEEQLCTHPGFSHSYELFDLDKVALPLTYRHWRPSDRIQPLGMSGSRLVSDIFSDAHLTPMQKAATWLVTDANGVIVWVVGHKISDATKVTPDTTRYLKLTYSPE